jgi:hypothetical protein
MHPARWLDRFRQTLRDDVRVFAQAAVIAAARVSHGLPAEDVV